MSPTAAPVRTMSWVWDYDSEGRVDGALLAGLVNNVDAHYFVCGPTSFMAAVQAGLEGSNVPIDQNSHRNIRTGYLIPNRKAPAR